ncbi:hypothetical protein ElyMa_001321700 [Elysia marginata]|uniref:Uncharacterized protein n=1 Tax=Elysia marginata TaxID=1093978 RepID=A0AAV4ILV2_9GAST|nr:hypothetical protein ElyMa_001321700 [Elysia marginata]
MATNPLGTSCYDAQTYQYGGLIEKTPSKKVGQLEFSRILMENVLAFSCDLVSRSEIDAKSSPWDVINIMTVTCRATYSA